MAIASLGQGITDIDNNIYDTIRIGRQIWFAKNLSVTRLNDGTPIANVTDQSEWAASTNPAYCWYNNDHANGAIYGALYNGYVVKTGKLCPTGWRVPSDAEWSELVSAMGGPFVAAGKLKATGTTYWQSPNVGATNEVGFSALPGGLRLWDNFYSVGIFGHWWSSTEYEPDYAWTQGMKHDQTGMNAPPGVSFGLGLSVRCMKEVAAPCRTTDGIQTVRSCGPYTWIDGITYNLNTNAPTLRLTSKAGCDSLVRLHLTILTNHTSTQSVSACDSYTWIDGNTYTTSTAFPVYMLKNKAGCDSLVRLNLTIRESTSATQVVSACDSYTWIDGNTYTASTNTPTFKLVNKAGCDSLVRLSLTIRVSTSATQVVSACDSYTWIDGNTYTASTNTPTFKLVNKAGCDSLVRLNLTIRVSTSATQVVSACDSYTWIDGNTYTASTNTPTFKLVNKAGCDSLVRLNLTIKSALATVTSSGTFLVSELVGSSYQWFDCATNNSIVGATSQSFQPTMSGTYRVEVMHDGCKRVSSCAAVVITDLADAESDKPRVYPNPVRDFLQVEFDREQSRTLTIYDAVGAELVNLEVAGKSQAIDVRHLPRGLFVLKIQTQGKTDFVRFINSGN